MQTQSLSQPADPLSFLPSNANAPGASAHRRAKAEQTKTTEVEKPLTNELGVASPAPTEEQPSPSERLRAGQRREAPPQPPPRGLLEATPAAAPRCPGRHATPRHATAAGPPGSSCGPGHAARVQLPVARRRHRPTSRRCCTCGRAVPPPDPEGRGGGRGSDPAAAAGQRPPGQADPAPAERHRGQPSPGQPRGGDAGAGLLTPEGRRTPLAPSEEAAAAPRGQGGGQAYLGALHRARAGGSSFGCGGYCCYPCPGPGGGGPWRRGLRGSCGAGAPRAPSPSSCLPRLPGRPGCLSPRRPAPARPRRHGPEQDGEARRPHGAGAAAPPAGR